MEKLYGVGVGPGDPDLITLRALRLFKSAARIFYPVKREGEKSTALDIIRPHLVGASASLVPLVYPMAADRGTLLRQWQQNAERIHRHQEEGGTGVFITLGDPSIYSTFMLTVPYLEEKGVPFEVVPGIPSFLAGAAATKRPLVVDDESLLIRPGHASRRIVEASEAVDTVVTMKPSLDPDAISRAMRSRRGTVLVERVGMGGERILWGDELRESHRPSYFSILISKRGASHE